MLLLGGSAFEAGIESFGTQIRSILNLRQPSACLLCLDLLASTMGRFLTSLCATCLLFSGALATDGYSIDGSGFTFDLDTMACHCTSNSPGTYNVTVPNVTNFEYGGQCVEGWCSVVVTTSGTTQHQVTIPLGYCLVGGSITFSNVFSYPQACSYPTGACPEPEGFQIEPSDYDWSPTFVPCPP